MAVERIENAIHLHKLSRCAIIYGTGVCDIFMSQTYQELSIRQALHEYLIAHGFSRIAFYCLLRGITYYDKKSLDLSRRTPTPVTEPNQLIIGTSGGPLKHRMLKTKSISTGTEVSARAGTWTPLSDERAIALIDAFMRDEKTKTAIVFMASENTSELTDSFRELRNYISDWKSGLLSKNENQCFFVFDADSCNRVSDLLSHKVPALYETLQKPDNVIMIPAPEKAEIERLIIRKRLADQVEYEIGGISKLTDWFVAENKLLSEWNKTLTGKIDLPSALQKKWISSAFDGRDAMIRLNELTGLKSVKHKIKELRSFAEVYFQQIKDGKHPDPLTLHMVFSGNPGTGKTTVARLVGEIFRDIGLLKRGHCVEIANPSQIIADHVGGTGILTNAAVDRALDGVLFIDEAYQFADADNPFAKEAITTLLTRLENDSARFLLIVAGYTDNMESFLNANPGLISRLKNRILFPDYSPDELHNILITMLSGNHIHTSTESEQLLRDVVRGMYNERDSHFGNAREMRNLCDDLRIAWSMRIRQENLPTEEKLRDCDLPKEYVRFIAAGKTVQPSGRSADEILEELDKLVGLSDVKNQLRKIIARVQLESSRNAQTKQPIELHMAFRGNPGTGKTTVARLVGKVYHTLGLLPKLSFVEASTAEIIGRYVGETEAKSDELFRKALGGVLFIDEAYRYTNHVFGQNFIDSLITFMENSRGNVAVIAAGYTHQMSDFFGSNQGLSSRFGNIIDFEDFSIDELYDILIGMAQTENYMISNSLATLIKTKLQVLHDAPDFSNARSVRIFFDEMKNNLALRLFNNGNINATADSLSFATEDIPLMQ